MDAPVQPGDILAQKYRVDRVLGVGGMGVVVAATQIELERQVAMKFMLDEAFQNPEARSRFLREARAAVRLRSEHVAKVLDTGTLDNGAPYIVMEFLEGTDLSATLRTHGALPLAFAAEVIVQACDALAEAHSQGIVHRDLKPANLFVTQRSDGAPLVKLLDFGISKVNALTDQSVAMTKTSALMGSPLYMSPEQMRSAKDVDHRTDVWSLGVVLYEALAGAVPFTSQSLGELLYSVMTLPHPPLLTMTTRQDIPPDVCALVDWCLQKDPAQRTPNVAEVARRLAPYCPPRTLPTIERISAVMHAAPPAGFGGVITASGVQRVTRTSIPGAPVHAGSSPSWAGVDPQGLPSGSQPQLAAPLAANAPGVPHAQTSAGWSGTSPGPSGRPSIAPYVIGGSVLAALVAGFLALGVVRAHDAPDPHPPTTSAAVQAPPALPSAAPPVASAPAPQEPAALEPSPPATTQPITAPSAKAQAPAPVSAPPAVSPAARARPAPGQAPKPRTGAGNAAAPQPKAPSDALPDGTR